MDDAAPSVRRINTQRVAVVYRIHHPSEVVDIALSCIGISIGILVKDEYIIRMKKRFDLWKIVCLIREKLDSWILKDRF